MSIIFENLYKVRNTITGEIKLFDSMKGLQRFLELNKDWKWYN